MILFKSRVIAGILMTITVFIIGAITVEGFMSLFSIRAMIVLACLLLVASMGQTIVMIIGGIDLSIPFMIGTANVLAATLIEAGMPFPLVLVVVLGLALLIGGSMGWLSAKLNVHPLIITLGIGTSLQGIALLWTKGFPSGSAPDYVNSFVSIGSTIGPFPFPWLVPSVILFLLIIVFIEKNTIIGRHFFALGSNPTAAPYTFINKTHVWITSFAFSSMFSAMAGILLLGFTGSAYAEVGQPYLFQTIAATVIGGTAISGGVGGVLGTAIGTLTLTQLNTILIGLGFESAFVQLVFGILIIILIALYGRSPHIKDQL